MKRELIVVLLVVGLLRIAGADSAQYGRIAEIRKSTSNYTKTWLATTPVTADVTTYTISVQEGNSLLVGTYDISEQQPEPPPDWVKGYAVRVQANADSLNLQSVTGQLRLHLKQRKTGRPMDPLTAEEKKRLDELDVSLQSLIGFSPEASSNAKSSAKMAAQPAPEPAPQAPPPSPASPTETVNVRSTPYLSEVFVDGNSMGYTPAKIALPPGKHTFRVEKPGYTTWTKEMMITVGPELTVDASLAKK